MALKPCRECGEKVSAEAKTCPHCGIKAPVKKKSVFGWIVLGVIGLGFVSAVLSPSDTSTGSSTPLEDIQDAPQPTSIACEELGPALTEALATSLTVQGGGTIRSARAARSDAHERAYYVTAEIDGPGLESTGDVGLWATNSLTDPGLIFSVNSMAREFSSWGDGRSTQAAFSASDAGAVAALSCAR